MVIRSHVFVALCAGLLVVSTSGCSIRHTTFLPEGELRAALEDTLSVDAFLALPAAAQSTRAAKAEEAVEPLIAIEAAQAALDRRISAPFMYYPYLVHRILPRLGDVIEHLDASLALDPTRADRWLTRGRLLDIAGDRRRARESLERAWNVQACVPPLQRDPARLRRDIAVTAAWLERDEGWWRRGLAWLDLAADDIAASDSEAGLLRGLLLAGRGDLEEAMRLSYGLPPVRLPVVSSLGKEGYLGGLKRDNDMLKRWLQAEVWMRRGRGDLAWRVLGEIPYWRRVAVLPHRLYQDLGLYAELTGDPKRANLYYALAYIRREYRQATIPAPLASDPVILDLPDRDLNYYRLPSGAFHGGSLLAYAAATAMQALNDVGSPRSEQMYLLASEACEICLRRGIYLDEVLALRGQLRFSRGRYVLAEMDLAEARSRFADRDEVEPWTSYLLGLIVMGRDRPGDAIALLEESLGADGRQAGAWSALGVARLQLDDRDGAREAFDRAIAADPELPAARFNRGLLRSQEGDLKGGLADFEAAARLTPEEPQIARVIQLAEHARRRGQPFMLGLDDEGHWTPAPVAVRAREDGAFAPSAAGPSAAWESRLAAVLDDVLAEIGALARADGLDAATLADLVDAHAAAPTPTNRKLLAHAFVWLDLPDEARNLLIPHWGGDLDEDEVLLLLWLDQRAGERSRLRELAQRMGVTRQAETADFSWAAMVSRILDERRDPKFGRQRTFRRFDAKHNRGTSYGAHWNKWLQLQALRMATGIGDRDGNMLVDVRGRAYDIPRGGSNHNVRNSLKGNGGRASGR